jgi:hypothetical protein
VRARGAACCCAGAPASRPASRTWPRAHPSPHPAPPHRQREQPLRRPLLPGRTRPVGHLPRGRAARQLPALLRRPPHRVLGVHAGGADARAVDGLVGLGRTCAGCSHFIGSSSTRLGPGLRVPAPAIPYQACRDLGLGVVLLPRPHPGRSRYFVPGLLFYAVDAAYRVRQALGRRAVVLQASAPGGEQVRRAARHLPAHIWSDEMARARRFAAMARRSLSNALEGPLLLPLSEEGAASELAQRGTALAWPDLRACRAPLETAAPPSPSSPRPGIRLLAATGVPALRRRPHRLCMAAGPRHRPPAVAPP